MIQVETFKKIANVCFWSQFKRYLPVLNVKNLIAAVRASVRTCKTNRCYRFFLILCCRIHLGDYPKELAYWRALLLTQFSARTSIA